MERGGPSNTLLKLEACWWMLRPPGFYVKSSLATAGWFAAPGHPGYGHLVAMTVALALSGGIVNVVNDVLDNEKDVVTAPELPLPSGIVTMRRVLLLLAVLVVGVLCSLALASTSVSRFLVALVPLIGAAGIVAAYSLLKPLWIMPPLLAAAVYSLIPLDAWLVAGAGGDTIGIVLAFTCCFGFAANFLAALRDVDKDPAVGNRSIAVRLGVRPTLAAAAAFDLAAAGCAVALAAQQGVLAEALPWAVAAALVVAGGYAVVWGRSDRFATGRDEGLVALRPANFARWTTVVLLIGVFTVPAACVIAAIMVASFGLLIPAYRRRIVDGQLRFALVG